MHGSRWSLLLTSLWVAGQASAGIVSLGDINGNGTPDIAVLSHGSNTIVVKDATTGSAIQTIPLLQDVIWQKFLVMPDVDHNGAPDLLVHKLYSSQTELRDSVSGRLLSTVQFDPTFNFNYADVAIVPAGDGSGIPQIAMLGQMRGNGGRMVVETRAAGNGALIADTFFGAACVEARLVALPDANGNGLPDFAVLCVSQRFVRIEVRDMSGELLRNTYLDKAATYLQMEALGPAAGGGGPRLALLRVRHATGATQLLVLDALTGVSWVRTFDAKFLPRRFAVMPDMNADGSDDLALLRSEPEHGPSKVQIRESTNGGVVKDVWFDKSLLPREAAVIPADAGNASVQLALLAIARNGERRVVVKDARSGLLLSEVSFDHAVTDMAMIHAGGEHTCGVDTVGMVECWGRNAWGGESTPPETPFTKVASGTFSTCGIRLDGSLACWGDVFGPLPAGTFAEVAIGAFVGCAIATEGSVACWGGNAPPPPTGTFKQLSLSYYVNCGLRSNGRAVCWGNPEVRPPGDSFSAIAAGGLFACGLREDGSVRCWGRLDNGLETPPTGAFLQITAGDDHACGVRVNGSVACWGLNDVGQTSVPLGGFKQVTAGSRHSCGLKTDGTVRCWGDNSLGQSTPGWAAEW